MPTNETLITALQVEVSALRVLVEDVKKKTDHHERILVSGDGDRLPLAEVVRNLTKTVGDYIEQKDKEEQQRRDQWQKVRMIVIGVAIPAILAFIGQAVIFYVRILPLIEKFTQ